MMSVSSPRSPESVLAEALATFGQRFAVVTSFQKEGMVVLDMAVKLDRAVRVLTLDTGRLPEETYEMMDAVRRRYGIAVEVILPDSNEVERMVHQHGVNLFRDEVVLRKLCCQIRKVRPLAQRLENFDAYAVGLRRQQSDSRQDTEQVAHVDGKWKLSPLAYWTADDVEGYTVANGIPVHPLYSKGYPSIGCGPCTRPVAAGESERAGRWWWEQAGDKECGLHFTPEGRIERHIDVLLRDLVTPNA